MNDADVKKEIAYLNQLLSEIDTEPNDRVGLRPESTFGRTAQDLTRREYELCKENGRDTRTLCVMLDQFTTDGSLKQKAKLELKQAISEFWAPGNINQKGRVYIEY